MSVEIFESTLGFPVSAAEAFAWHERDGALERLTPPWERVELVGRSGPGIGTGVKVTLRNRLGPFVLKWVAEHRDYVPAHLFRDVALSGPFASWDHRHEFSDTPGGGSRLRDHVEYRLPGGWAGRLVAGGMVRGKIASLFAYRQAVTRDDLCFARDHAAAGRKLRILVSGTSGLIGGALVAFLRTQGHEVLRLVRREKRAADEVTWQPESGRADFSKAGEIDAVVHLAGAGIADRRWTAERRREIRESRVRDTRVLAEALAARARPPAVVIGGSAIGYYGSQDGAWLDEGSAAGGGFLADVTQEWEAAWAPMEATGARRVYLRTGVVLSPAGGALAKMLTPFSLGLGGPVGDGRQYWSWISIDDMVGAIGHALLTETVRGPMNAVAPEPVTSADFARTLGRVLHRPAVVPAPAFALRAVLGRGLADEALLASQRVRPSVLAGTGYRFRHENLEGALRHVLGRVC
jgi:hypothetical protein